MTDEQRLLAENERLRRERDAAKEDLQIMYDKGPCPVCDHFRPDTAGGCELIGLTCVFSWRGPERR